MKHWSLDAVFYHIYPLGFCGCEEKNDYSGAVNNRLLKIREWIPHMKSMGINTLYLGPLFTSESHGYDSVDYFSVDRRLGSNSDLRELTEALKADGIRVVLDGVFNHVSRDFFAFRDLIKRGERSLYRDWFKDVNFSGNSPYNDGFSYSGWRNHYNLPQLNLSNGDVVHYLLEAVKMWISTFNIDGLRLDVADVLDFDFMKMLSEYTNSVKDDFWLMGEVIHGDYSNWINSAKLNSVTNYECYKGFYSSFNDLNFFEIAYSLNRLFNKKEGLYRDYSLYNFVDNHDVNRIVSTLNNESHIYPLHILLFTIPGIPSIYSGSEWGIGGEKVEGSDKNLRPLVTLSDIERGKHRDLINVISILSRVRKSSSGIKYGSYEEYFVDHEFIIFIREYGEEKIYIAVNSSDTIKEIVFNESVTDLLSQGEEFLADKTIKIYPCWGRILRVIL